MSIIKIYDTDNKRKKGERTRCYTNTPACYYLFNYDALTPYFSKGTRVRVALLLFFGSFSLRLDTLANFVDVDCDTFAIVVSRFLSACNSA